MHEKFNLTEKNFLKKSDENLLKLRKIQIGIKLKN